MLEEDSKFDKHQENTQLLLHWFTIYYAGEILITIMKSLSFYILILIYFVTERVYFLNIQ